MKSLFSFAGRTIQCVQPSVWKLEYEVRSGDEVVGTIRFLQILSRRAEAESADGRWIIEDKGFFRQKLSVSRADDQKPVADYVFRAFGQNTIRLSETRILRFKRDFWKREYSLTTDMNMPLLKLKEYVRFKGEFEIILDRRAETTEEFPWLFFLVVYIAISNRRRRRAG
ncbi:MAG: hypothetical protein WEB37_01925 [Bacteroidota bacterium]